MIKNSRRFHIPVVVFCCLVGSAIFTYPSAAWSQSENDSSSAGEHAKRAQVAYDLQDWPTAIQEYQAAYRSTQKPEYLWGIAQAQRLGGECAKAISTYKAYRRTEVTPTQATAAELQIMKCEAEILKQDAAAANTARKSDGAPAASASRASAPAQVGSSSTSAQLGKEDARTPFYKDVLGDALLGTGVVVAGIGAYFLLKGNSDMNNAGQAAVYRDYDSRAGHASREQVTGAVMLSTGGLLVAGAALRYLTLGGGAREEPSALIVGPNSVAWYGRF
jgi:hypothetical protein